jgi:type II secretory pathway component HofQ
MVVSGETAIVEAVEQIPYTEISDTAQGGASAMTSTQFKDVGVKLKITAILTSSDNIFLKVETEQSVKTSESVAGVPVVDT